MVSIVEHVTFLKNERPPVDASGARAAQSYAQTGDERVETWHVNQEIRRISRKFRDSIYHWATPSGLLSRRDLLSVITRLTVEHRFSCLSVDRPDTEWRSLLERDSPLSVTDRDERCF